jgi:hypothetical protein
MSKPLRNTQYVKRVKEWCPNAYGWQYDDQTSDTFCPDDTSFNVTYCPGGKF